MELTFLYPRFLFLLLLIPFFVFVYFFSMAYNRKKAMIFANFEALERFYDIEFFSKNFLALYMNVAILLLFVLSLAGMAVSFNADTSAFSYIMVIDSSQSMSSKDFSPNRLEAAKSMASSFIDLLPVGVEVGIVSFSGDAKVLQVLDSSKLKSKMAINGVRFGDVSGTNIYNALITANKLFENRKMKSVVLISDGQLNIGDAPQVRDYVVRNKIIVNTIAIGTKEGGLTDLNIISEVDEDFLKAIAFNSGGNYFTAKNPEELSNSLNLISQTNKLVTLDISFYLVIAGIVLLTINWILYNLRFKMIP